eukprot:COSAG03_NODE_10768_length_629_cov_1.783019_1_plen_38_part_01
MEFAVERPAMTALLRPALEGAGAVAATRAQARRARLGA